MTQLTRDISLADDAALVAQNKGPGSASLSPSQLLNMSVKTYILPQIYI